MTTVTMTAKAAAPDRSLEQRRAALRQANAIRTARSQLKRDIKAGRVSIHALLLEPPEMLLTAKLFDILLAVPKYGRVKVTKVLTVCRISPSKTIGGLSERQRKELVGLLQGVYDLTTTRVEYPEQLAELSALLSRYPQGRRCRDLATEMGWSGMDTAVRLRMLRNRGLVEFENGRWRP
jgi:hypothetical protein